jgi:hypothetical protein
VLAAGAAATSPAPAGAAAGFCPTQRVAPGYARSVASALKAKQDVWGNALVARRDGPTFGAARRYLRPLLFAGQRGGPLTRSGVYYLPFAQPLGAHGAGGFALHVADGSEILSQTANGSRLTVLVGAGGRERYGSCLVRLTPAALEQGYLPILQTRYVDALGVRYRQESFVVRGLGTNSVVSFVKVVADARAARGDAVVRLATAPAVDAARAEQNLDGPTALVYSDGGVVDGASVRYDIPRGEIVTVYAGRLLQQLAVPTQAMDEAVYDEARARLIAFWRTRLSEGVQFVVPEAVVLDAEKALLIQQLALTWRYSIGNQYQQFSFAEALDTAQVMASYGYFDVAREILRLGLDRLGGPNANWRRGAKLVASAAYVRLSDDRAYVEQTLPALGRAVRALGRQLWSPGKAGLLRPERYSSDIAAKVYGLHSQTVAWQGLRAMADVWQRTGHPELAATSRDLANRLGRALERAVRRSSHRLPDGSLFVPAALLAGHEPFDVLTDSRPGSYWNLVVPYALASGFFPPHGERAASIFDYMSLHGSRLLGLVRAGAYGLYGSQKHPASGTDEVYGLEVSRFLADNDRPDQLVLSLYGMLAAAMTPGTFVSGEAATVAPLRGHAERSMFLPPNVASNAAFLETLRLLLVHETRDSAGRPAGLELAFSTPRPWLQPGKTVAVNDAPTSFGPLSYEIHAFPGRIQALVEVPSRRPPRTVRLRLRLPSGQRLTAVRVDGRPARFDALTGTVDLGGRRGEVAVAATFTHT